MINHIKDTYPEEGCGALIGKENNIRLVKKVIPIENKVEKLKTRRYVIDPEDIINVEKKAKEEKLELLGFFHSHPNAPAEPSTFDLEHSWPWYSYIIISINHKEVSNIIQEEITLASWRLKDDRSKFDEEELIKYKEMLDDELITQEDFDAKKKELLGL